MREDRESMSEDRESCLVDHIFQDTLRLYNYHCSIKSDKKPIKNQCFLKCWLLLAIADHDAIHFGCLHDN